MSGSRTRYFVGVNLAAGSIVSLQFGAAFAATLFDEIGTGGTAFLRTLFAAALLGAIWRPRLRGHAGADLRVATAFGAVLAAANVVFYLAIERIPLSVAVTIAFAGPLAIALNASRRLADIFLMLLAAAGIACVTGVFGTADTPDPVGVGFALLAAALWASYILLMVEVGERFQGGRGLAIALSVSALLLAPIGVSQAGDRLLQVRTLVLAAVVCVLSSVIPYSFQLESLRRVDPGLFAILTSLEPAAAAVAGFVVLHQTVGASEAVGIAIVVGVSTAATIRARPGQRPLAIPR